MNGDTQARLKNFYSLINYFPFFLAFSKGKKINTRKMKASSFSELGIERSLL